MNDLRKEPFCRILVINALYFILSLVNDFRVKWKKCVINISFKIKMLRWLYHTHIPMNKNLGLNRFLNLANFLYNLFVTMGWSLWKQSWKEIEYHWLVLDGRQKSFPLTGLMFTKVYLKKIKMFLIFFNILLHEIWCAYIFEYGHLMIEKT